MHCRPHVIQRGGDFVFDTLASQIGAVFVVLVCGFAFLKGDEMERLWAGAYVLAWFATLLIQGDGSIYHSDLGVFFIDLIMLVIIGAMVWKSKKSWPTWACALQLLMVMSHLARYVDLRPSMSAFITVINLAGYGVLVALAVGTFWAWQDRKAAGLE